MEDDRELAHKNALLGWALFAVFLILFSATIAAAFIYLALD